MSGADLDHVHVFEPATRPGAPTLLVLHGTGGNEHDLVPLGRALVPGAAILSPRGKILERGQPRFFRRLAEGVFDLDDLRQRTHELADFVAAAAERYHFDPSRVVAAGFSNGANIAASVVLLRPGTIQTALLYSPMVPLVPDPLPDLRATTVFISAGKRDPLVSPEQTQALADLLSRAQARVTLRWTDGGHSLTEPDVAAGAAWLKTVPGLSPQPA
jgi:phospholipase/carboxylesterase/glyoxalase family protein